MRRSQGSDELATDGLLAGCIWLVLMVIGIASVSAAIGHAQLSAVVSAFLIPRADLVVNFASTGEWTLSEERVEEVLRGSPGTGVSIREIQTSEGSVNFVFDVGTSPQASADQWPPILAGTHSLSLRRAETGRSPSTHVWVCGYADPPAHTTVPIPDATSVPAEFLSRTCK